MSPPASPSCCSITSLSEPGGHRGGAGQRLSSAPTLIGTAALERFAAQGSGPGTRSQGTLTKWDAANGEGNRSEGETSEAVITSVTVAPLKKLILSVSPLYGTFTEFLFEMLSFM